MSKQRAAKAERRKVSAVYRVLKRDGVHARLEAVQAAMSAPNFGARFRKRIEGAEADLEIQGIPGLQVVLYRFLKEDLGLDTRDVQIYIDWQPQLGRKMTFSFGATVAAVGRARDIVAGKLAAA